MRFLSLFRDSAAERAENCIFSHTHKSARLQRALQRVDKASQSFAPAGAKQMQIIFPGGVYVGKNTLRPVVEKLQRSFSTVSSARLQRALSRYNRIQIIPPVFSLMIRESVCLNFIRTSSGMRLILVLSPSLTSS